MRLCEEEQRVFRFIAARERSGRRTKPVDIKAALNLTPHIWTQLLDGKALTVGIIIYQGIRDQRVFNGLDAVG